jgi:DNA repair protein RadA
MVNKEKNLDTKSETKQNDKQNSTRSGKEEALSEGDPSFALKDLPGVGAATADKLLSCGYDTMMSIAVASPDEIVDATGLGENVARRIISAARSKLEMGFESGDKLLDRRKSVLKIESGSDAVNKLLGGGFETGSIIECFGEFGSGKTQIAHVLSVRVQQQIKGATAVYLDTENTFRPERIEQIAKGLNMNPKEVLKNIKVARAYNSDHQMLLAEKIDELVKKEKLNLKLVVVDSLTAHFRAEFVGRGTLANRQQKLNRHMHTLLKLADTYNLCVYVTNQVMSKPDVFFGDPTNAIGGHIVAHASTFRVYLRKGKKRTRVAKLIDSPSLPEGEAGFVITEAGLQDI